jgi:hypothetical protein
MSFARQLEVGRVAEGLIASWLQARGTAVMPAYEIEKSHGKGPQLFSSEGEFVAPDMIAFTHEGVLWIEAKHKSVFTWHRITQRWVTGIDFRHYLDYQHVMVRTRLPVWLLFYHRESTPNARDLPECPAKCPTGLFGGSLERLMRCENHRSAPLQGGTGWGKSGMVYWAHNKLTHLATKEEVLAAREAQTTKQK